MARPMDFTAGDGAPHRTAGANAVLYGLCQGPGAES